MELDLSGVRALSFDCYGTLIDWETGIWEALQPWAKRTAIGVDREGLLREFGAVESVIQTETPNLRYPLVLAEALRRIAARLDVDASEEEALAFGASVGDWPAFPDSADALRRLKTRFKLIILSNVDRASFAESQKKLGVDFDLVLTAEDIGSYKPDQRNFDRLFAELASIGVKREELVHVAESLFHDHAPALANNLPSVWIHRRHGKEGTGATHMPSDNVAPALVCTSMADFAAAALGHP